jgi:hypothetical protein
MLNDRPLGWMLIVVGSFLLIASGRLEWISLLLPVSLILACAIMWFLKRRVKLSSGRG